MMGWFKNRKTQNQVRAVPQPVPGEYPGDWITVPFRFVEALRVSMHTVLAQEEVPAPVRLWMANWLRLYNHQLAFYMKEYYGPYIIPLLDQITKDVMPDESDDSLLAEKLEDNEVWKEWERQFTDGGGDGEDGDANDRP